MDKSITRTILFLLSPLLSIPFVLHGVYHRNKNSIVLFVFIISIVSYLFIPKISNDKAYYYYLYESLDFNSFASFYSHLITEKTDFLFYLLIYFVKSFGIPLRFLFFFLTASTVGLWYSILLKLFRGNLNIKNHSFFLFFLLIFFSFSPAGLFSGIRFLLGVSLVLYGFVSSFLFNEKRKKAWFYITLGCLTHFSCFVFVPVFFLVLIRPHNDKLYLGLFLLSFLFMFLPRDLLLQQVKFLNLSDVYLNKANGYLGETDYIENSLSVGNFNNALKFFFKTLWVYLAYFYIYFYRKQQSVLKNSFLIVLALCNLFFSAPTVYNRFLILALGLFIFLIIKDNLAGVKNTKFGYILLLVLSLNFMGNIYAMKESFIKSINDIHSLSLVTIFLKNDIKHNELD